MLGSETKEQYFGEHLEAMENAGRREEGTAADRRHFLPPRLAGRNLRQWSSRIGRYPGKVWSR